MFKQLSKLALNQYIVKLCSVYHFFLGFVYIIFGLFCIIFNNFLVSSEQLSTSSSAIESIIFVVIGSVLLLFGVYSFITGYGLWKYKKYARILLLIELYAFVVLVLIYLIIGIVLLFTAWYMGLFFILCSLFSGVLLYMIIYLFQNYKQMVVLFKKGR